MSDHEPFDFGMSLDGEHIANIRCRACHQEVPCLTMQLAAERATRQAAEHWRVEQHRAWDQDLAEITSLQTQLSERDQQIAALREACDLLLPFAEEWAENGAEREVISRARALLAQPSAEQEEE